jgi:Flp pilus assembly pilin Flp
MLMRDKGRPEGLPLTAYLLAWLRLHTDRRGVTALEYGLIGGVIVAVVAAGFRLLANSVSTKFTGIGTSL